jgi:starch phosphorylase
VEAYLGELQPEDVRLELYADPLPGGDGIPERIVMERKAALAGSVNGYNFGASLTAKRPAEDYTPRIVPYHPEAFIPMEEAHIMWMR